MNWFEVVAGKDNRRVKIDYNDHIAEEDKKDEQFLWKKNWETKGRQRAMFQDGEVWEEKLVLGRRHEGKKKFLGRSEIINNFKWL